MSPPTPTAAAGRRARIAVCGAGWWSQGWHLPHLSRNPHAAIAAIVDPNDAPHSPIASLEPTAALGQRYSAPVFRSVEELLSSGVEVDGVLVCTSHTSHFAAGMPAIAANLHVLMEKPMTTDVAEARAMAAAAKASAGVFMVNNTANWRPAATAAAAIVEAGDIGRVQHVACSMHVPLLWLFDDPIHAGWTQPSGSMPGNGFAWGQLPHLLSWVFRVSGLSPTSAFAAMSTSGRSGADVCDAAVIRCGEAAVAVSGSACVPAKGPGEEGGEVHAVGKRVSIRIFGSEGMLTYEGDDQRPESGGLELRRRCGEVRRVDGFQFENYDEAGTGPESLQAFIDVCRGQEALNGADEEVGLRCVAAIDAMYRSAKSGRAEDVI